MSDFQSVTVYRVSSSPLAISEVVGILQNLEQDIVIHLHPVKPKGGEI